MSIVCLIDLIQMVSWNSMRFTENTPEKLKVKKKREMKCKVH